MTLDDIVLITKTVYTVAFNETGDRALKLKLIGRLKKELPPRPGRAQTETNRQAVKLFREGKDKAEILRELYPGFDRIPALEQEALDAAVTPALDREIRRRRQELKEAKARAKTRN